MVDEIVGLAHKHRDFGALLTRKSNVRLRDIMTIGRTRRETIDLVRAAPGVTLSLGEADQVVDALTLSARDVEIGPVKDYVSPPFIELTPNMLLTSLYCCMNNPYDFLVDSLRRRYRSDWDRHVNSREEPFRSELYALFSSDKFETVDSAVKLRDADGRLVTDLDAVVYDSETKTVGLFQLKWQDRFGIQLRKRRSQASNFNKTVTRWVNDVSDWIDANGMEALADVVGLKVKCEDVRLFVVGRHAAFFTGVDDLYDLDAAFVSWHGLRRLVWRNQAGDSLRTLFCALREHHPTENPHATEIREHRAGPHLISYPVVALRRQPC